MTDVMATAAAAAVQLPLRVGAAAPPIRAIERSSVHRICSNQVIVDLSTATKELVENALDAGATTVTIAIGQYGAHSVEVSDNGRGIDPTNYAGLALKHWTSKLREFTDLADVRSFGFRGEALSSLCAMADVKVCTRCEGENMATSLVYNHEGVLVEQKPASRTVGTTVTISGLFSTLPVRHRVFLQSLKKEYAKMLNVIQSYAMVCTGVRIQVYNTVSKDGASATDGAKSGSSTRTLVMSTQGSTEMRDLIGNILGAKQIAVMQEVNETLVSSEQFKLKDYFADDTATATAAAATDEMAAATATAAAASVAAVSTAASASSPSPSTSSPPSRTPLPYRLFGFISKCDPKCGRSAADRQYLFINHRPVDLPRLTRAINDAYRSCNAQTSYPVFVLDLLLPPQSYDVNLTPNKREIMVHNDVALFGLIRDVFDRRFEPTMYTYRVKELAEFGITVTQMSQSPTMSGSQVTSDEDSAPPPQVESEILADEPTNEFGPSPSPVIKLSPAISPPPTAFTSAQASTRPFAVTSLLNNKRATPSPPSPTRAPYASPITQRASSSYVKIMPVELREQVSTPPTSTSFTSPPPTTLPLVRHHSTPAAGGAHANANTTTPVRSVNSFFGALRSVSSPRIKEEAQTMHVATEDRASKRMRVDDESSLPPLPPAFSRQPTMHLPHSSSPIDLIDSPPVPSPVHVDGSPDFHLPVAPLDDDSAALDDATDIGVQYQTHAAQRTIDFDISTIEHYYSNSKHASESVSPDAPAATSLLHRASTLLSPSAAASHYSSLGCSIASDTASSTVPRVLSEESMRRVIEKSDFLAMEIVGQFNLGFIIAKRGDDLSEAIAMRGQPQRGDGSTFIIDQHATDEKYRFETLQATTVLNSQPLLNPLPIDLSPAMEITLRENMDIFRRNGFGIDLAVDDDVDDGTLAAPTHTRIRIKSLPFSKNITFGANDIHELCAMLAEAPGVMVRLPKVTSMFASRACRSSVMIGTALGHSQMSTIVRHMADMDHPWACPHGRPTISHLADLRQFASLWSSSPIPVLPFAPTPSQLRHARHRQEEEGFYGEPMAMEQDQPLALAAAAAASCCKHQHG